MPQKVLAVSPHAQPLRGSDPNGIRTRVTPVKGECPNHWTIGSFGNELANMGSAGAACKQFLSAALDRFRTPPWRNYADPRRGADCPEPGHSLPSTVTQWTQKFYTQNTKRPKADTDPLGDKLTGTRSCAGAALLVGEGYFAVLVGGLNPMPRIPGWTPLPHVRTCTGLTGARRRAPSRLDGPKGRRRLAVRVPPANRGPLAVQPHIGSATPHRRLVSPQIAP